MYITLPPLYTYIYVYIYIYIYIAHLCVCRRVGFDIVIFVNFKSIYACIYLFTTGMFINHGPLKLRYSQTSAMAKHTCLDFYARQASGQDVQHVQDRGGGCCNCGWTTDAAMYPTIFRRPGCEGHCTWREEWSAWCVTDTGRVTLLYWCMILHHDDVIKWKHFLCY